jgi:TolB-like protein/Tfp pilus assembly protein PilF
MPQKKSKLNQFWQELKRRRVVHVVTVYASASFVLIELVNNLSEPLNLPDSLATIVVIVLAVGFPLSVILAWIYDLTPEGIEKTKSEEESKDVVQTKVPNAWRIATYISFMIIVGLVTLNIVGGTKNLHTGDIRSLVILPFDNFTGDDALENLVSGMHSSLITDIGRVGGLQVKSRTSSNAFKGKNMTIPEIASELKADAALETAVTCMGDTICIQFRLVKTSGDEEQLWVADYREAKSQALNLYNRITKQIAEKVMVELSSDEEAILAKQQTVDPYAYDAYLTGLYHLNQLTPRDFQKAMDYFQRAIDLDPDWADPHAGMSVTWMFSGYFGIVRQNMATPKINLYLDQALELDPNSAFAYYAKAVTAVWTEWDWEKGEKAFKRSLELNPNIALCRLHYAHYLFCQRRQDEALVQAKLGLELDPLDPLILSLYAVVMRDAGKYASAVEHFEKAMSIVPNYPFAKANIFPAYRGAGYYDIWIEQWKQVVCWDEEDIMTIENTLNEQGYVAAVKALLKVNDDNVREGKPCQMDAETKKMWYIETGEYDKAYACLEEAYELGSLDVPYMASDMEGYEHFKSYPGYVEILKEFNLPY